MNIKKDIIGFIDEGYSFEEILDYCREEESYSKTEGWQEIIQNFHKEI